MPGQNDRHGVLGTWQGIHKLCCIVPVQRIRASARWTQMQSARFEGVLPGLIFFFFEICINLPAGMSMLFRERAPMLLNRKGMCLPSLDFIHALFVTKVAQPQKEGVYFA